MDFSGPEPADFANVESLNRAFLRCVRRASCGRHLRQQLPQKIQHLVEGLTDLQIGRLSAAPFLLVSLRERDEHYWQALFDDELNSDMLVALDSDTEAHRLAAAGLAFLWALAKRNPYATRLVSGATLNWCEQLADYTMLQLLQQTVGRRDLMQPRFPGNEQFWSKLLGPGLSSERDVRTAAHITALQSVLTEDPTTRYRATQAAACSTMVPSLRVADRNHRQ
jgi:hypothetical protein